MNSVSGGDSCLEDELSDDDSSEELKEIESRLYSIIHYNNLSETVPSDLPEGFQIDINESNEVVVSLKSDASFNSDVSSYKNCVSFSELERSNCDLNESCIIVDEVDSESCKNVNQQYNSKSNALSSTNVSSDSFNCHNIADNDEVVVIKSASLLESTTLNNKTKKSFIKYNPKIVSVCSSDTSDDSMSDNPADVSCGVIDSSDLITNSELVNRNNKIEEIVISSGDEHRLKNNTITPERSKVKTKKKRKLEMRCPKKWNSSMMKYYSKISKKKLRFDAHKLISEMRGMRYFELLMLITILS